MPTESIQTTYSFFCSLQRYEAADDERRQLERVRNALEEAIYSTRGRITDSDFVKHTTDEERTALSEVIANISAWYDDEAYDAPRSVCCVYFVTQFISPNYY